MKLTNGYRFALIILSLAIGTAEAESEERQSGTTSLYGLWAYEDSGHKHHLKVIVNHRDGQWSASVDGHVIQGRKKGEEIHFSLANGQHFVGKQAVNHHFEGSWTLPSSEYGFYSKMATMVSFTPESGGQWRGEVELQPRPVHLFLDIFKGSQGGTKAALRNPQRNSTFGASVFDVLPMTKQNNQQDWKLVAQRGGRKIAVPFTYSDTGNDSATLALKHPMVKNLAIFHRATRKQQARYFSRIPGQKGFKHQSVKALNDGWKVQDAVDAGFDGDVLDKLVEKLATADPRRAFPALLNSVLVSYQGKLV